ncbi:hypothetical protein AB6Q85_003297 [Vibrio cholerae]
MIGTNALAKELNIHRDVLDDLLERIQIDHGAFPNVEWDDKKGYLLTEQQARFFFNFFN